MSAAQVPWWKEPTREQWWSFAAAWVGWVLDAFDFTIFLLAMPFLQKELGVSITATATSVTLTLLVRLLGGVGAGFLADRYGRRLPLMLSIVWFALCDGAIAFAPSFQWILIWRTLFGLGMGAEWTAGTTLAMENWPERSRGIASGALQGGYPVGYLIASVVSAWVIPAYGWRAMFLLALLPALIVLPIRFLVPESRPKAQTERALSWKELRQGYGARFVWACAITGLGFAIYYGMSAIYPTMLVRELGYTPKQVAVQVSLFNLGMLGGTALIGYIAGRFGLAWGFLVSSAGMLPILPLYVGWVPALLPAAAVMGGAIGLGIAGISPLLLTSIFPASVRARAVGAVYHVGAFTGALMPTLIALLGEHGLTLSNSILVVCITCELLVLALLPLRPKGVETRSAVSGLVAG
jgi:MFS transporter, SHS family, lactate transporter